MFGIPPGEFVSTMAAGRRQRCIGACLLWYLAMVTLVGGGVTEEVDETEAAGVVRAMKRKIKVTAVQADCGKRKGKFRVLVAGRSR